MGNKFWEIATRPAFLVPLHQKSLADSKLDGKMSTTWFQQYFFLRLDRIVYVPLPDSPTRLKILCVHTKRKPIDEEVSLKGIADRTEGYSGAELAAVCNEAALKALEEAIEGQMKADTPKITMDHFESALKTVTPRINEDLLNVYAKFQQK